MVDKEIGILRDDSLSLDKLGVLFEQLADALDVFRRQLMVGQIQVLRHVGLGRLVKLQVLPPILLASDDAVAFRD